jgi:peptidoglycan/xylan/chitin deacetylase (PgdA/CDA1 family)
MLGGVPRGTVIVYHAVGTCPRSSDPDHLFVAPDTFGAQMRFLTRRRTVVPLQTLVDGSWNGGRPAVAITFDDAFRSVLTHALPVLGELGLPATVFVPTGALGRPAGWYEAPGCETEVMTEDELRQTLAGGLELESHGSTHLRMAAADEDEVLADLADAAEALERITGRRPRYLAYPYGPSSPAAERAARRSGLTAAFTVDEPERGRFALARVGITARDGTATYALKTSGRYLALRHRPWLDRAYRAVRPVVRSSR